MFWLSSLLGPSKIKCAICQRQITLDRREWPQMDFMMKTRYWFITLVYTLAFGFVAANSVDYASQVWDLNDEIVNFRFQSMIFQNTAFIGASLVIIIQWFRPIVSDRRCGVEYHATRREMVLGLQWNLQAKLMLFLGLIFAIAEIRYAMLTQFR